MHGLGSLSFGVLVFACIFAWCDGGPSTFPLSGGYIPISRRNDWAEQSGSFAASVLNVKWLYNIAAQGLDLQPATGGRYGRYRLWFRAYNYATSSVVKCSAQVHWPGQVPPPSVVHVAGHVIFVAGCLPTY